MSTFALHRHHAEVLLAWPVCRARHCATRVPPTSERAVTTELGRFCDAQCFIRHYNEAPFGSYEGAKIMQWSQDGSVN